MALTSTRTHTRWFGDEQLDPIRAAIVEMTNDWSRRRLHVSDEARRGGDLRLEQLNIATQLAGDLLP